MIHVKSPSNPHHVASDVDCADAKVDWVDRRAPFPWRPADRQPAQGQAGPRWNPEVRGSTVYPLVMSK